MWCKTCDKPMLTEWQHIHHCQVCGRGMISVWDVCQKPIDEGLVYGHHECLWPVRIDGQADA